MKMRRNKWYKRILPMLLSVAMLIETVPQTVLAASYADPDSAVEETTLEETAAEAPYEESGVEVLAETGGTQEGTPKAVITVDRDKLAQALSGSLSYYGYAVYNFEEDRIKAPYMESANYITRLESSIKNYTKVNTDVEKDSEAEANLKYTWQQSKDGSYAPVATEEKPDEKPHNAGSYRLAISLDAKDGVYTAADTVYVDLEIEKAILVLQGVRSTIPAGYTVSDLQTLNNIDKEGGWDLVQRLPNGSTLKVGKNGELNEDKNTYDYVSALAWKVTDAYNGSELGDTYTLQMNKDYYLELSDYTLVADKNANYELEPWVGRVTLINALPTKIEVEYKTGGKTIGKIYDGTPFDAAAVEAEIKSKTVKYEKDGEWNPLEGAEITGTWCDSYKKEYKDAGFAPKDAGTYYYKLSYKDANGTYAAAYEYVQVTIKMAELVITPQAMDAYKGMTADEVRRNVKYIVYQVQDGELVEPSPALPDDIWGVAYSYSESGQTVQKYVPYFEVQSGTKGEDGKVSEWDSLDADGTIEEDDKVSYRVIFSGEKALYDEDGGVSVSSDINDAQKNYHVDVLPTTIEDNAAELTVKPRTEVTISVDAILQDGKLGNDLNTPITKTYDGKGLYNTKGDYKKAVVTAKDANYSGSVNGTLTYTWYKAGSNSFEKNENGNYVALDSGWRVSTYNNVENLAAPSGAGVYRLKISYEDDTCASYAAAPAYVYYVIKPQDAILTLTGAGEGPAIYADGVNTISSFLYSIQRYNAEYTDTYAKVAAYPVTIEGKDSQNNAIYTKGETPLGLSFNSYYSDPITNFRVEKKSVEGDTWTECDTYETFVSGTEYRLRATNYSNSNYNFGKELDVLNQVVTNGYHYENETIIPITLKKTEAIGVQIKVDEDQLTKTKIYDGKPFDLTELKDLVKVVKADDGADVTDALKDKLQYKMVYKYYYSGEYYYNVILNPEAAIHGGEYTLEISLETDETYTQTEANISGYTITQRELTVTPKLKEDIKAGEYSSSTLKGAVVSDFDVAEGGLLDGDDKNDVISSYSVSVYDSATNNTVSNYIIRSNRSYYAKITATVNNSRNVRWDAAYGEYIPYAYDYKVAVQERSDVFAPKRAAASVIGYSNNTSYYTELEDSIKADGNGSFAHTIKALEGVPYLSNGLSVYVNYESSTKTQLPEGNYFVFTIYAPTEFNGGTLAAIYENSIKDANGYVYAVRNSGRTIDVVFDASLNTEPEFKILWEKDYEETFKVSLKNMVLEADMTKAVAPKSLAFNGVNTKMAVGDTQQLDVKVTKAQMSDVVLLGYSVLDGGAYIDVTDTGFVTALSKGTGKKATATVEVYACRMVNGVKERIAGKEGKSAKVKITVSDVAAPKLSKVIAQDTWAEIQYKMPANGYRREIYVLSGKKKAQDFENELAKVQNGDYRSAFVFADILANYEEDKDDKDTVYGYVENLEPESEYTVYVRNVSGLRTLDNGKKVGESYAGSVKSFKTVKSQAAEFKASLLSAKKQPLSFYDYDEDGEYDYSDGDYYSVKLADKSAMLSLSAKFYERYSKSYSDMPDYIWRSLPLSSADKKNYTTPKMTYYVSDSRSSGNYSSNANYVYVNGYSYWKGSNIAAINNSGKITLKGKGDVYVIAVDSNTGRGVVVKLYISASPDSVAGKSVKLLPGQTITLSQYLTYKENKTAIVNYQNTYRNLSVAQKTDEYFKITPSGNDYQITALKPGGKLDLEVEDAVVKANGGKAATVKLTSAAVDPVKQLKASSVYDDQFTVKFTYPQRSYKFRVELKDARGKVISNQIRTLTGYRDYSSKKEQYVYTLSFGKGKDINTAITLLSNYTVAVTAVYDNVLSKEAKTKVKTTNIPASKNSLDADDIDTGCNIRVSAGRGSYILNGSPILMTGNTYTLNMLDYNEVSGAKDGVNVAARTRLTDTLTWKSTNTKVATVKVNAGTYSAQLKTVKQGTTKIEVTSKITKKVIARWTVMVSAVGEANSFYGDNQPYNGEYGDLADIIEKNCVELTRDYNSYNSRLSVTLNPGEAQWFVFVAPAYGSYTIYSSSSAEFYYEDGTKKTTSNSSSYTLEKNQKCYLKVTNSGSSQSTRYVYVSSATTYTEVYLGDNEVTGGQTVIFKAPSADTYVFTLKDSKGEQVAQNEYYVTNLQECYVTGTSDAVYTLNVVVKTETQPGGGDQP